MEKSAQISVMPTTPSAEEERLINFYLFFRLWLLDRIVKIAAVGVFGWYVFIKHNFVKYIIDAFLKYYEIL